ncbi:hypothetical protein BGX38DRAFT_1177054 [Terfezia claveryi]|nr:hypothetical protein BGX38DRAFT_1177054 [Terfezia claveryi]
MPDLNDAFSSAICLEIFTVEICAMAMTVRLRSAGEFPFRQYYQKPRYFIFLYFLYYLNPLILLIIHM